MKSILITGANRGLGAGFVKQASSRGFKVFAAMRDVSVSTSQENVIPIKMNVSSDKSIADAFEAVKSHTDSLNIIVNNAGANKKSATDAQASKVCNLEDLDRDSLLKMFSINSIGPLMVVKHFLPLLKNDPNFVINISSDRASFHDEIPNSSANYGYRASKIALNMLTFNSLMDLPKNVKTAAVHPGSVLTDMNPAGTETPEEQTEKILSLTENWKDEWNGKFLRANGECYPL